MPRYLSQKRRPRSLALKSGFWVAILVVLLAAAAIRVRLLDMPLERDEGEYACSGQLMLQGIPPYLLACNMKLPGIYAAYALLMAALGQTTAGIHLGLLLVNGGAIMLIALLGARLFGTASGIAGAAAYALMSVGPAVLGAPLTSWFWRRLARLCYWCAITTDRARLPSAAAGCSSASRF